MFQETWQTWLILRHFLPARLQRQLVHEIIAIASGGTIQFDDLFEELVVEQPVWNEAWMVRPRDDQKEYGAALQSWARSIVWQNDEDSLGNRDDETDTARISLVFLNIVTMLATADFGYPENYFDEYLERYKSQFKPSLQCYLDALKSAQREFRAKPPIEYWDALGETVASVEMPLRAIMVKHFADLCVDADAWKQALEGYQRVESLLATWSAPAEWSDVAIAWKTIVMQSRANASFMLLPNRSDPSILETQIDSATLAADPVLAANAALDMSANRVNQLRYKDPRISVQWSPLLHQAHEPYQALSQWTLGRHQNANRWFWATLRRQIALGAATEARATKGRYARCLIDEISTKLDSQDSSKTFVGAMRLLLESQNDKHIAQINWTPALVDAYVTNEEVIKTLLEHAHAYEGTKIPRTLVLVEIFQVWALKASRGDIVVALWKTLAHIARDFKAAFTHQEDVGRTALEALQELGKTRPGFIPKVGPDVAEAICKKSGEAFEWGRGEAAKAALPYAEAIDEESLRKVTSAIITVLETADPAKDFWPMTRPALRYLVDHHVRVRLRHDEELNRRALEQIFRHGLASENQPMMVFFHLADFDDKLLQEPATREKLAEPLERVRKGALQSNSSNVTDHIRALLVAPQIAGFEGIHDALDGLKNVVNSAKSGSRSMGFTAIDGPVLLLVEYKKRIRKALPEHQQWFDDELVAIANSLAEMWEFAPDNALIFAPFAIPARTKPNAVVIHNCAFASMRFAAAVGQDERMANALDKARKDTTLRGQIDLARATHFSGAKHGSLGYQVIADNEDKSTFYAAMGRRLTYLQRLNQEDAKHFATQLVKNCLRLGPHSADAAVLIAAANLGLHDNVRDSGLHLYEASVRQDPETRPLLLPILDLFSPAKPDQEDEQ